MVLKKAVLTAVAVLMVISVAYLAFCQDGGKDVRFEAKRHGSVARMMRAHFGRLITLKAELNLTDEQCIEIKKIIHDRKEDIEPLAKQMIQARRTLTEAVLDENPDERKIRRAAGNLARVIGDAAVLASEIAAEARKVLTEEQIELLEDFSHDNEKSMDKHLEKLFD